MSGTRGVIAAATVLAVALAAPGAASAESLVYVKGGNVWVARPDGSHAHRVTRNGTRRLPYVHPTQADNGTIVALRATDIHRFTPRGRRVWSAAEGERGPLRPRLAARAGRSVRGLAERQASRHSEDSAPGHLEQRDQGHDDPGGKRRVPQREDRQAAARGAPARRLLPEPVVGGEHPPARLRAVQLVLPRGLRRHPRWIDRWLVLRRAQRRGRTRSGGSRSTTAS